MTSAEAKAQRLRESQLARAKALARIDPADPEVDPDDFLLTSARGSLMSKSEWLAGDSTHG